MRYLVVERGLGLAILIFAFGILLFMQATLFARPVLVSEKDLLLLIASIGLIACSVWIAIHSIRKVSNK